jgi:hypothetical protein
MNKDGNVITNVDIINLYNTDLLSASEMIKGDTEPKAYALDKNRLETNPVRKARQSKGSTGNTVHPHAKMPNPFA